MGGETANLERRNAEVTASAAKPSFSIAQGADQLLREGDSWSAIRGVGIELTYAFRASATPEDFQGVPATFFRFNLEQMEAYELALQAWADVADIRFVRMGEGRSGEQVYSNQATLLGGAFTSAVFNVTGGGVPPMIGDRSPGSIEGDTWFNNGPEHTTSAPISRNNIGNFVHELGHALGLEHPGDYGAVGSKETYENDAAFAEDTKMYSVMSYFGAENTGGVYNVPGGTMRYMNTPQMMDVAAIQKLYGANTTTRSGDTVYGFNSNAERIWFQAEQPYQLVFTVWDAGGHDTFDFSGYSTNAEIDLNAGAFSSVGLLRKNVAIALGVTIEGAVGGSGADAIVGNAADNRLQGMGGDDRLAGGDGIDTAVFRGRAGDYALSRQTDGSWTVRDQRADGPDGADLLVSMEKVVFSNAEIDLERAWSEAGLKGAYAAILAPLHRGTDWAAMDQLAVAKAAGETQAQAVARMVQAADATTSVATMSYQFFTGKVPTEAGIAYLVSPVGPNSNNLNSAYYQDFNLENRYINFAVNLGKLGDGRAGFEQTYGSLSLAEATKKAFQTIFGAAPTDAKVTALLGGGRDLYFASYGGDGVEGLGAKAAMVGWLLAEAVKADIGLMARSNDAFLTDLADGAAFAINMVGVYGRADWNFAG